RIVAFPYVHALVRARTSGRDRVPDPDALEHALARARQRVNAQIRLVRAPLRQLPRLDDPDANVEPHGVEQRGEREPDGTAAADQDDGLGAAGHDSLAAASGKPRASRGRRPASPIVCRASIRFAPGKRSNAASPSPRTAPNPGTSAPKSPTRPCVKSATLR